MLSTVRPLCRPMKKPGDRITRPISRCRPAGGSAWRRSGQVLSSSTPFKPQPVQQSGGGEGERDEQEGVGEAGGGEEEAKEAEGAGARDGPTEVGGDKEGESDGWRGGRDVRIIQWTIDYLTN